MITIAQPIPQQAQRVADAMTRLPGIIGITLGGSVASGLADESSDLDIYIYWRALLAEPEERAERLRPLADEGSLRMNILTWGLEDHLQVQGKLVEVIYFDLDAIRADVERAYGEGLISNAYTTSLLYTLASSHMLHDATGEVTALRERLHALYPEPTRDKLLRHHPELLRFSLKLLWRAQERGDLLFVQQMRYEIQATCFDLLFALNRLYHPGGKRLLIHGKRCLIKPDDMSARWERTARIAADDPALAEELESLVEDICGLAEEHQ